MTPEQRYRIVRVFRPTQRVECRTHHEGTAQGLQGKLRQLNGMLKHQHRFDQEIFVLEEIKAEQVQPSLFEEEAC